MLKDLTIQQFIDTTASSAPVPGGGSISALNGSIAAALGQMVCRLTLGRKKYADREADINVLLAQLEPMCRELMEQIDRDSEAYNTVMEAFKLPKDTDEEKAVRADTIQSATRYAAEVPMQVARLTVQLMPHIETLSRIGNQNAVTDACVAAMCARTGVLGALLNVRINLSSINDVDYVKAMQIECESLQRQAESIERTVRDYVETILNQ